MWEVSRWRGVRGEENSDVGGVKAEPKLHSGTNAEFPMESLNTISLTHTGLATVKCVGVESLLSIAGNKSIMGSPPTFNELTRAPEPATLGMFLHPVLTQPHTDIPLSHLIAK